MSSRPSPAPLIATDRNRGYSCQRAAVTTTTGHLSHANSITGVSHNSGGDYGKVKPLTVQALATRTLAGRASADGIFDSRREIVAALKPLGNRQQNAGRLRVQRMPPTISTMTASLRQHTVSNPRL